MAGYLGAQPVIAQIDGYQKTESETRYVNADGDTMTGDLVIQSVGGTNSACLQIDNTLSSGAFSKAIEAYQANIPVGTRNQIMLGKDGSPYDTASLQFYYAGNASTSNRFEIGFWNADSLFNVVANGNIGIGTTTIGDKVVVQGTAGATASVVIQDPTANDYGAHLSYDDANSKAIFGGLTNGTKNPALRVSRDAADGVDIDGNGNIGVGISSVNNTYTQSRAIQLTSRTDNNWGGTVMLTSADGSTVFSRLVASTDGLDLINTKNTNIRFFTNNTELMRLTSSGLAIGDSMQPTRHGATTECLIFNSSTTTGHAALHCGRIGTGTETQIIFSNAAGQRGNITTNHSAVQYNTSSDYRLKENVVTDWDATSRLKQLKPSRFNFKVDKDTTVDGFLAHEVSSIVPEATTGTKDEVETYTDEDGKEQTRPVYQGIDQSKLVPLLTKALQEAVAKIEALETKNDALEARLTALEVK